MILTRRFVFRGNAAAVGGQLYRPDTIIIETDGASSLGVVGGRSIAELEGRAYGDVMAFDAAFTLAEGLFDDPKQAAAVTDHQGYQDQLTTTTTVTSEVRGLKVGVKPVFTAKRIRATLVSRTPGAGGEPPIAPQKDTTIQGAAVGGFGLVIALNLTPFQRYDTHSKLVAATADPRVAGTLEGPLLLRTALVGQPPPRSPRLLSAGAAAPVVYATIVREIRWADRAYPGARIDGHTVIVPDFGTIYFGELLISSSERRLTMARFDLGSPIGGYGACAMVDTDGSWFP